MLEPLLADARADENVLGIVVFGSRGKGAYVTDESDWDVFVVVREQRGERPFVRGNDLELVEITLEGLRQLEKWMRYAVAWVEPQLDKTGEVAAALRDVTAVDPATAAEPLDGYINFYYRSLKNDRAGLALESYLDAVESVPWFLEFAFAVHGRLRPYNKWLPWELEQHPLPRWDGEELLCRIDRIARTGAIDEQRALFVEAEAIAREHGLGAVVDGWEPDVAWLRGNA